MNENGANTISEAFQTGLAITNETANESTNESTIDVVKRLLHACSDTLPKYSPKNKFFVPTLPAHVVKGIREYTATLPRMDQYIQTIEILVSMGVLYQSLFFDNCRRNILKEYIHRLKLLDCHELRGNWYNSLMVGIKGVGKSSFLQAIAVAHSVVGQQTTCIYYSCDAAPPADCSYLPSQMVAKYCDLQAVDIAGVIDELKSRKHSVFLILDEYQSVFHRPAEVGVPFHEEVSCIGSAPEGSLMAIVSGSAVNLRDLCFTHVDLDPVKYPSYMRGTSLNSQRFTPVCVTPLLVEADFVSCLEDMYERSETSQQVKDNILLVLENELYLHALFLACGGRYRALDKVLAKEEMIQIITEQMFAEFTHNTSTLYRQYKPLWEAMVRFFQRKYGKCCDAVMADPFQTFEQINREDLEMDDKERNIKRLYQAADHDAIVLSPQSNGQYSVSFGHPFQFYYTKYHISTYQDRLTYLEEIQLRYPYGTWD